MFFKNGLNYPNPNREPAYKTGLCDTLIYVSIMNEFSTIRILVVLAQYTTANGEM